MPPKGRIRLGKAPGVDLCYVRPDRYKPNRRPVPERVLINPRKTNLVGANGHGIRKIPPPPANKAKK